jgi:hypothetical protein
VAGGPRKIQSLHPENNNYLRNETIIVILSIFKSINIKYHF